MKLAIETWVLDKGYSTNIRNLFNESIICYRNGAYRASLIFSYTGFLTIIKETIIKSQPPTTLASEWPGILIKINNDDLWEKEVIDALSRTTRQIFPISEDLKLQIKYWKDRRNDCAHFKNNEIESHHTEAFWSFVKSNVPKITVEGGMESLLNKFEIHFDETKTPPDMDFTPLIKEIENSVLMSELHVFFDKLKRYIDNRRGWFGDSEALKVYAKILDITSSRIQESLILYLKEDERDMTFLSSFPDKVPQLNYLATDIRKIWKTKIFNTDLRAINPFSIVAGLLRNDLIPKSEIEEVNEELFNNFDQKDFYRLPEKRDIDTFKSNGLFDVIYKIAFEEKKLAKFLWVNSKCDLLIVFLENTKLNVNIVKCICEMADSSKPSQWLIKALNESFINIPKLKVDFHKIATTNSIKIPSDLR